MDKTKKWIIGIAVVLILAAIGSCNDDSTGSGSSSGSSNKSSGYRCSNCGGDGWDSANGCSCVWCGGDGITSWNP